VVVSEIASNHAGDIELAKRYIEKSKEAGADIAKFQYFRVADGFFPRDDPRFGQVKKAELSLDQLGELWDHCERVGIGFLVTPFKRVERVEELASLGLHRVKIREADSRNGEMVRRALALFDEVYISATRIPLDPFLMYHPRIRWLMATPKYPYPLEEFDLGRVPSFDGLSDHTVGITASVAACSVAAASGKDRFVLEKHVTLDRRIPNPDQAVSVDFRELAELVGHLRALETIKKR